MVTSMGKRILWVVGLVAFVMGFLITQQIRTVNLLNLTAQAEEGQTLNQLVTQADQANVATENRISQIDARLTSLGHVPSVARVQESLSHVKSAAGLTTVVGAGIAIVMHDGKGHLFPGEPPSLQLIHDQYVLRAIALISGAGATAISINGQRYTATTSIYCAGPTIRINGVPFASPFIIRAVGPAAAMQRALRNDPDIQGWSQLASIKFHPVQHLEIGPYNGLINFSLAKPVKIAG